VIDLDSGTSYDFQVFTGLTLINTGTIPEIPTGELALVGVSNGVYLAAKAAGKSTK
jgi:hypothetical protein